MKTTKSKIDIILETVQYYSINPRSSTITQEYPEGECVYHKVENDKVYMCAVGRCLLNPKEFVDKFINMAASEFDEAELNSHLKLEYRGHGVTFWNDIQKLHDNRLFWINATGIGGGLNQVGIERYNSLIIEYIK